MVPIRDIRGGSSVRTCAHNLTVSNNRTCRAAAHRTALLTLESRGLRPPHLNRLFAVSPGTPHSKCALPSPRVLAGTGVQVSKTCTSPTCEPRAAQFTTPHSAASLSHLQLTSNLHAARLRDLTCAHLVDVLDGVVREQAGCLLACLMVAELICGGLLRALELPFEPEREGCRAVKGRCGGAFDK
jgi:hypothetical protein